MILDLSYDATMDVLYVKEQGSQIHTSDTLPDDLFVVLSRDAQDRVVGLVLIEALETVPRWNLFHTSEIPEAFWQVVDAWARQTKDGAS